MHARQPRNTTDVPECYLKHLHDLSTSMEVTAVQPCLQLMPLQNTAQATSLSPGLQEVSERPPRGNAAAEHAAEVLLTVLQALHLAWQQAAVA